MNSLSNTESPSLIVFILLVNLGVDSGERVTEGLLDMMKLSVLFVLSATEYVELSFTSFSASSFIFWKLF